MDRMLSYSFPLLIAGLSGSINDTLDKVIIEKNDWRRKWT